LKKSLSWSGVGEPVLISRITDKSELYVSIEKIPWDSTKKDDWANAKRDLKSVDKIGALPAVLIGKKAGGDFPVVVFHHFRECLRKSAKNYKVMTLYAVSRYLENPLPLTRRQSHAVSRSSENALDRPEQANCHRRWKWGRRWPCKSHKQKYALQTMVKWPWISERMSFFKYCEF
jgi:hypothetical protein